jgi:hypothetical protein
MQAATMTNNAQTARKQVSRMFDSWDRDTRNAVLDVYKETAEHMLKNAPKRTGLYRASFRFSNNAPHRELEQQDFKGLTRKQVSRRKVNIALQQREMPIKTLNAAIDRARVSPTGEIDIWISNLAYYGYFVERGVRGRRGQRVVGKFRTRLNRKLKKVGMVRR